jgi:hypothetical protein
VVLEQMKHTFGETTLQKLQDGNYKFERRSKTIILTPTEADEMTQVYLQAKHIEEMDRALINQP